MGKVKKIGILFLLISVMACLGLTACGQEPVHSHTFTVKNVDEQYLKSSATCETTATYYYSCTCGAKSEETFEYGEILPHAFTVKNVDEQYLKSSATCETAATYYYSCTCGEKGTETFTVGSAIGHRFTEKTRTNNT